MTMRTGHLWATAYELDFTAATPQDLKSGGDGNKTVDGKTWVLAGSAGCSAIDIGANGLRLVANTTNSSYFENARTSPILAVPIATLFPTYSTQNHVLRLMVRTVLANQGANFEAAKFGLEDATTPVDQNLQVCKIYSGGAVKIEAISTISGSSGASSSIVRASSTTDVTDDVLGMIFEAPNRWEAWTGVYSASESPKMRLTNARANEVQKTLTPGGSFFHPLMYLSSQPRLFLALQTGNADGNLTVDYTHLRLDYYSKNPPR